MIPRPSVSRDSQSSLGLRVPRAAATLGIIFFVIILGRAITLRHDNADMEAPVKLTIPLAAQSAQIDSAAPPVVREDNNAPLGADHAGPKSEQAEVASVPARDQTSNADPVTDSPPADTASNGATAGDIADGEPVSQETEPARKQTPEETDPPMFEPAAYSSNGNRETNIPPAALAPPAVADQRTSDV